MNQPITLEIQELTEVLKAAVQKKAPAVMTHQTKGKWHMTKVHLAELGTNTLTIEIAVGSPKKHSTNIQIDQPVGLSLKSGYNKFVIESIVTGFEPSIETEAGGRIMLEMPERAQKLQRRSFFRVPVPKSMKVKVLFWHRGYHDDSIEAPLDNYWQANLADVSAGGMQIIITEQEKLSFKVGQIIGLQFTPMPYEKPLLLEGQVRHIAKSADGDSYYLGLQLIGLEISPEGRQRLHRLCAVVENYYQINQTENHQPATTSS